MYLPLCCRVFFLCSMGVVGGLNGVCEAHDDTLRKTDVKTTPDVVIYRGSYPGWPWVAKTPMGRLLCVWREGTVHEYSPDGRLMLSSSDNGGTTWTMAKTILDVPHVDDRNVALLCLSDTEYLVTFNSFMQDQVSRVWVMQTDDGGKSWSIPQMILNEDARTRAAAVRLTNGDLVLQYYRGAGEEALLAISTDRGCRWTTRAIPNAPGFMGDEWDFLELADRSIVGILRNAAPTANSESRGWFYKTASRDHGRTWTQPTRTDLRDVRSTSPAQLFLHQGKPVVLYSNARKVSVVMATTDDPELVRWNVDQQQLCYIYLSDGVPINDGSYPVSVPLFEDRRLVVDYVHDGDSRTISGYIVDMSDLFKGRK
ncbi:MAG: sialidase family protein [Planctomycetales bacterium]|nr:sialidase family protein [Planctomycetales bacterium]